MGKAQMVISEISIPQQKVVPTGGANSGTIGHNFNLKAKLKVSKRTLGPFSGEGIDYPQLEWKESIDWFELIGPNEWKLAAQGMPRDLFAENPSSNTFRDWVKAKYFLATDETNNPPEELTKAVNSNGENASLEEKEKLAKHWIANNGFEWTVGVTDRPAMGLNPTAGSRGGGGESLVTSNSRRRVIYFDLGFKGSGDRVKATQVLESIEGRPTIQKFFPRGIPRNEANDEQKLGLWRSQFGQ
ncbi:unnamed protein product [Calypogeia fissa]